MLFLLEKGNGRISPKSESHNRYIRTLNSHVFELFIIAYSLPGKVCSLALRGLEES